MAPFLSCIGCEQLEGRPPSTTQRTKLVLLQAIVVIDNFLAAVEVGIPFHHRFVFSSREEIVSGVCYQYSVLELGAALAVRRHCRPVVSPGKISGTSEIDHRFDGKNVPGLHRSLGLVLVVVGYVGYRVEQRADSVPAVGSDDAALILARGLVDGRAQIAIERAGFDLVQRRCKTIEGCLHQFLAIVVHVANKEGLVQISVVSTFVVRRYVDVDDVTILNLSVVRDTVTNHLVHGSTNAFRETIGSKLQIEMKINMFV